MRPLVTIVGVLAGLVATCSVALRQHARSHYAGLLPQSLELAQTIAIEERLTGLTEGCAMAVFALDPAFVHRLRTSGLRALETARHPRSETTRATTYAPWRQTPADLYLSGLRCAPLEPSLEKSITAALGVAGSYYAQSPKSEIVVIPSLSIVVFSVFD